MSPDKRVQDEGQGATTSRLNAMEGQDNVADIPTNRSPESTGPVAEADEAKNTAASTPNGIRSSPPVAKDVTMNLDTGNTLPEDSGGKSDSEAETIVLPGKDGHSPSKVRKSIKHEDKSDDEGVRKVVGDGGNIVDSGEAANGSDAAVATSTLGKRKRAKHNHNERDSTLLGNSSGLSSVPTSPVATTRSSLSKPAASESDVSPSPSAPSPHATAPDKAKSVDRVLPRRKQHHPESGDEGDSRRLARQRSSGADHKQGRERDNRSTRPNPESHPGKRPRSASPLSRNHRRSISGPLPAKTTHGVSHKKKRPPALQTTEYQSDDSSASGSSSHPRSSRLRTLAAPVSGESSISPAKVLMPQHKKLVNSSGQTFLARACAAGKLDVAKQRLEERPGDLNVADNALNTPLHTASLDGHADIVKLLLDAGCAVDPVNVAKDTPLHDAIENGHVDVVRLLLDAGANPTKANRKGEVPYDLLEKVEDRDDAELLRELISAAKEKIKDPQRLSEDDEMHEQDSRMSHAQESPRHTPPGPEAHLQGPRNHRTQTGWKLHQPLDVSELRKAATAGDTQTVLRILDVHNKNLDDTRALIAAAKAGHDVVVEMLFGKFEDFLNEQDPGSWKFLAFEISFVKIVWSSESAQPLSRSMSAVVRARHVWLKNIADNSQLWVLSVPILSRSQRCLQRMPRQYWRLSAAKSCKSLSSFLDSRTSIPLG